MSKGRFLHLLQGSAKVDSLGLSWHDLRAKIPSGVTLMSGFGRSGRLLDGERLQKQFAFGGFEYAALLVDGALVEKRDMEESDDRAP
ncbi:hypothetical protein L484_012814 [Morus notabilis]|uniref:Uncharacterized protein n=1 Tax=Morus notabilis TaxID=981085 RepID=W9R1H6_9ROSA|nr:hypothetical protein L484_012814 [Morus notabilis]